LSGIFSTSCLTDNTAEEIAFQQAVDTVYNRALKTYTLELDSICESRMEGMIQSNMDSIKTLRLQEIEELIKKPIQK